MTTEQTNKLEPHDILELVDTPFSRNLASEHSLILDTLKVSHFFPVSSLW
jgi:hypothetical protein